MCDLKYTSRAPTYSACWMPSCSVVRTKPRMSTMRSTGSFRRAASSDVSMRKRLRSITHLSLSAASKISGEKARRIGVIGADKVGRRAEKRHRFYTQNGHRGIGRLCSHVTLYGQTERTREDERGSGRQHDVVERAIGTAHPGNRHG